MGEMRTWTSEFRIEVPMRLLLPERPGPTPSLAVLLHGMGQTGAVIARKLAPRLGRDRYLLVPDGPLPFEQKAGERRRIGRAWYLFTGDQEAFLESAARTQSWLEGEIDRVRAEFGLVPARCHLVGYSQGGYLAGIMLMRSPGRYASLVTIASRLKSELWPAEASATGLPPIAVLHGERDDFIPLDRALEAAEALRARGAAIEVLLFPCGHELEDAQAEAAARFLDRVDEGY